MQTQELRQKFMNYFRKNDHKFLRPSNIFIDDPSLFFVNAGMNQLKDVFLGNKTSGDYTKLMNSQICIRAGGKHNDFDDVGKDSYHLTCFEMLGNWSLADYGKEVAIDLAFNFLIEDCKLNKEQIYVTYFMGNDDIPEDIETKEIWKKYVPENRIVKGNTKDNFWMMGDEGPCGFCTEIHYDLLGNREVHELVNNDDPTLIEIWNIVFMQFNKVNNEYTKLNSMFVDTGMGLERLSMVLQNKKTLYETDVFRYLMGCAQMLSNCDFYANSYNDNKDMAYRIFADHIRTSVILIFQGVEFDSHGRGFILRKIFRRLLAYYYVYLADGLISPIMHSREIELVITKILNYFLFSKHDAKSIQDKFIVEEKLALDKWTNADTKYKRYCKQFKNDTDKAAKKLKENDGIDCVLVENIGNIRYK